MALDQLITPIFGSKSFAQLEHDTYEKYQQQAETEIIDKLQQALDNPHFLNILKHFASKSGCRFLGYREINIRLKSGAQWKVRSPMFQQAEPKKRSGRRPKRRKGTIRHLGLELLGIVDKVSPALVEICTTMAVLCPSFVVAATALRNFGITINDHLLQNITSRFSQLLKPLRVECSHEPQWEQPGLKILICVDGGRTRERKIKRGRRKDGLKRQGYTTDWFEPRLFAITLVDEHGKKVKSVAPIYDGSCGDIDQFFELLKSHLQAINLDEAAEIVFCADGGNGIWSRTEKLIDELGLKDAKQILDYTHAKQNIAFVTKTIADALKLEEKERRELSKEIKDLLWAGNIDGIAALVKEKLPNKRKAPKAALAKLNGYFGNHARFQYQAFREAGLPTGSGSIESAIRRVINLRIKGAGLFWKKENAENIILIRSLVLTGKLKAACQKVFDTTKNTFYYNMLDAVTEGG